MSGCRGRLRFRIHSPWLCNKHSQRARSQEGAAGDLVPCSKAHWGRFMEKQRRTCPAATSLFIVSYSLKYVLRFQDNTLKLLHKYGENLQTLFQDDFRTILAALEWYSEAKFNHFGKSWPQTLWPCVSSHVFQSKHIVVIIPFFNCTEC